MIRAADGASSVSEIKSYLWHYDKIWRFSNRIDGCLPRSLLIINNICSRHPASQTKIHHGPFASHEENQNWHVLLMARLPVKSPEDKTWDSEVWGERERRFCFIELLNHLRLFSCKSLSVLFSHQKLTNRYIFLMEWMVFIAACC